MNSRLATLVRLAKDEYHLLNSGAVGPFNLGGSLLLGRHYAHEAGGILMLGLNPGGTEDTHFCTDPYDTNLLLPEASDRGIKYWRHAHWLFGVSPLHAAMETATFAFCCPFRTRTWSGLPKAMRDALERHSRPILTQMLEDCRPRLVIVAGVAGLTVLRNIAAPRLRITDVISDGGDPKGTYQWRAYRASFDETDVVVAQIPHLSRANSQKRLENCGRWLGDLIGGVKPRAIPVS